MSVMIAMRQPHEFAIHMGAGLNNGNNILDKSTAPCYPPFMDAETKQVLLAILQMMKDQAVYLHRQHGWLIAVADSVDTDAELSDFLKTHPFYNQGPRPDVQITNAMIQNIDLLIQRLKD
jgi:hypothetical protein